MSDHTYVFNIEEAARRYHVDTATARKLWEEAREEFGDDMMMAELHAIRAIRRTRGKIDEKGLLNMFKPRLYLDTSVISALFDERTPERKAMTEAAWARFPEYNVHISSLVMDELNEVSAPLRETMRMAVADFTVLQITSPIENLAQQYVDHGIIPDKYYADALHVAVASFHQNQLSAQLEFQAPGQSEDSAYGCFD